MKPFIKLLSRAAPVMQVNIDTDQIIRINRLIDNKKGELGAYCLESLRYFQDGKENPEFKPNMERYRDPGILICGANFGCGSSREHAVWALMDWGVRCVIAPSFGDIFYNNSFQNGLLPIRLSDEQILELASELEDSESVQMHVDLNTCEITTPTGRIIRFEIEPERRNAMLKGLDEIGMTLRYKSEIEKYRSNDEQNRPWIYRQKKEPILNKILMLAGDGIGPEIMAETHRVAKWFAANRGVKFELREELFGISSWTAYHDLMPDKTWNTICDSDAILFGAIGSPEYDKIPAKQKKTDQLLRIRKELDLFINYRPVRALAALADCSTLREEVLSGTDMILVRELSSGIYFGEPRGIDVLNDGSRRVYNTMVYTSDEIERIARAAFELARTRSSKVCSVDKGNVLENGVLWRETVIALHDAEFPDIELTHMYVDNAAMQLVRNPRQFDVIVTENLFGDILSDCAAMVAGSIGMMPSVSMSADQENGRKALYEPIHGSAPDIAGKNIANPLGSILSFAMCLRYTLHLPQEALFLENAVERVISSGIRTPDIAVSQGKTVSTSGMGDAVLRQLEQAN